MSNPSTEAESTDRNQRIRDFLDRVERLQNDLKDLDIEVDYLVGGELAEEVSSEFGEVNVSLNTIVAMLALSIPDAPVVATTEEA